MLIVWGYFRTGTTLVYTLLEKCNPNKIVLYEPDHTELPSRLLRKDYVEPNQPISFNPFKSYWKLGREKRMKLLSFWKYDPCPKRADALGSYLGYLHQVADAVKVNRWGFILPDLVEKYGDKVLVVVRDIVETVASHVRVYLRTGDENCFENKAYFKKCIEPMLPKNAVDSGNIVDRVVTNYMLTYDYVLANTDHVLLRYEWFERDRERIVGVEKEIGFNITCKDMYLKIKRSIPDWLRKKVEERVEKIVELGLVHCYPETCA